MNRCQPKMLPGIIWLFASTSRWFYTTQLENWNHPIPHTTFFSSLSILVFHISVQYPIDRTASSFKTSIRPKRNRNIIQANCVYALSILFDCNLPTKKLNEWTIDNHIYRVQTTVPHTHTPWLNTFLLLLLDVGRNWNVSQTRCNVIITSASFIYIHCRFPLRPTACKRINKCDENERHATVTRSSIIKLIGKCIVCSVQTIHWITDNVQTDERIVADKWCSLFDFCA